MFIYVIILFIIVYFFFKNKGRLENFEIIHNHSNSPMKIIHDHPDDQILLGISTDKNLYRLINGHWIMLNFKTCCVKDLTIWNKMLLGLGDDGRLYKWIEPGLWKKATEVEGEWLVTIGTWKNKLLSGNLNKGLAIWTGEKDDPFTKKDNNYPTWKYISDHKFKNITSYRNKLYAIASDHRLVMFEPDKNYKMGEKLIGKWLYVGNKNELLLSIAVYKDTLMAVGMKDGDLLEYNVEINNWVKIETNKPLINIYSFSYDLFKKFFSKK